MATGERDLEVLLKTEDRFPPPPEFAKQANANDPAEAYRRVAAAVGAA